MYNLWYFRTYQTTQPMDQEPKKPDWLKDPDVSLGGIPFNKELLEKAIKAAKESGIENEDILKQTAFQLYNSMLLQKSVDRIKNNAVFWFWILFGWILVSIAGLMGLGLVSALFS
tara:strand:+ start:83 stop:427 length:345 start_codon:yes stop_codon:yes gene_type:complete